MSDHAPPMKDQMKIWTATWMVYSRVTSERQEGAGDEDGEEEASDDAAGAHCRFAMMPPGRAKIITMKTTKAIT